MLRKLSRERRARIESAAVDMVRLHGEHACEVAREKAKQTRDKHLPMARYWTLVAFAISTREKPNFTPLNGDLAGSQARHADTSSPGKFSS